MNLSSSSSSASSSGRVSLSSRATSPSSEKADSVLVPTTYVYAARPTPEFLTTAFNKHVDTEGEYVLGVVFDNGGAPMTVDDASWRTEKLGNGNSTFTYHVSTFPHATHIMSSVSSLNLLVFWSPYPLFSPRNLSRPLNNLKRTNF